MSSSICLDRSCCTGSFVISIVVMLSQKSIIGFLGSNLSSLKRFFFIFFIKNKRYVLNEKKKHENDEKSSPWSTSLIKRIKWTSTNQGRLYKRYKSLFDKKELSKLPLTKEGYTKETKSLYKWNNPDPIDPTLGCI